MGTALGEGRKEDAERLAHSIKGLAANLGAVEVRDAAAAIENVLRAAERVPSVEELARFSEALAVVNSGISQLPVKSSPEGEPTDDSQPSSPAELLEALQGLEAPLKGWLPKESMAAIEKAQRLSWPDDLRKEVAGLSALIGKYKFKDAVTALELLKSKVT